MLCRGLMLSFVVVMCCAQGHMGVEMMLVMLSLAGAANCILNQRKACLSLMVAINVLVPPITGMSAPLDAWCMGHQHNL